MVLEEEYTTFLEDELLFKLNHCKEEYTDGMDKSGRRRQST